MTKAFKLTAEDVADAVQEWLCRKEELQYGVAYTSSAVTLFTGGDFCLEVDFRVSAPNGGKEGGPTAS